MKRTLYYFILRTLAGFAASLQSRRLAAWWSFTWDKLYTLYMLRFLQEGSSERILLCRRSSFCHPEYIRIGEGTSMQRDCRVEAHDAYRGVRYRPEIIIGKHCNFGEYNHLTAIHRMVIGDGVLTGRRVTISDNNHGPFLREVLDEEPALRVLSSKGPVTIGDNVWIGENACVLSGVTVGRGSVIAANAVVTRDVPPYSLVAGVPAKVIRQFV